MLWVVGRHDAYIMQSEYAAADKKIYLEQQSARELAHGINAVQDDPRTKESNSNVRE
jgi:hypothetical protein